MGSEARSSDDHLLVLARGGDMQAFRRIVERYESTVAGTVVGILGPGPDAEDAGQETFIRFFRSLHQFRGDSGLRTYLAKIAVNAALRKIRQRKSWMKRFVSSSDSQEQLMQLPPVEGWDETSKSERISLVRKCVSQLSPNHRAVVVLRMIEGYTTPETARILGVAQGTVASRLSRALAKLRLSLAPFINEEIPHG